jgi:hypothetical protein
LFIVLLIILIAAAAIKEEEGRRRRGGGKRRRRMGGGRGEEEGRKRGKGKEEGGGRRGKSGIIKEWREALHGRGAHLWPDGPRMGGGTFTRKERKVLGGTSKLTGWKIWMMY